MKNLISTFSTSKAALVVGITFITSVVIVSIVDDILLANFVVPGNTEQLAKDIESNEEKFGYAVIGYFVVLLLDSIIAFALYVVLKSANRNLAFLTAALRLLYVFILVVALLALVFQAVDAYGYAAFKQFGYAFFAFHILLLGFSVLKSRYIPKILGILLIIASFTYIVFFVDLHLPEFLEMIIMLTMAIAELSLSIWLIVKRKSLP